MRAKQLILLFLIVFLFGCGGGRSDSITGADIKPANNKRGQGKCHISGKITQCPKKKNKCNNQEISGSTTCAG